MAPAAPVPAYNVGQRVRVVSDEDWRADIAGLVGVVAEPPAALQERLRWPRYYREESVGSELRRVYWVEFDSDGIVGAVDGAEVEEGELRLVEDDE